MPRRKTFLSESEGNAPWTWWDNEEVGHTQEAKKEVSEILGDKDAFPTPKPVRLIERILALTMGKEDTVLDSFAGSGTSIHAALSLNHQDGGARKAILVQQPFDTKDNQATKHNIAREVTAERVRHVIQGYTATENGKKSKVPGLGGSFTYARVGEPLFGEYRNFGEKLPTWIDLAKYIFYTETSRDIDLKRCDEKSGFVGETSGAGGMSYYLFYSSTPDQQRQMSLRTLTDIVKTDKNRQLVIYTERIWVQPDELADFERKHGRSIRPMQAPFAVK